MYLSVTVMLLSRLRTVSYTHLDVYKRQLHNIFHITVKEIFLKYFRIIFHRNYIVNRVKIIHKSLSQNALIFLYHSNINAGICIKAVFTFSSGHLPVSYTHLDVYKRQRIGNMGEGTWHRIEPDQNWVIYYMDHFEPLILCEDTLRQAVFLCIAPLTQLAE